MRWIHSGKIPQPASFPPDLMTMNLIIRRISVVLLSGTSWFTVSKLAAADLPQLPSDLLAQTIRRHFLSSEGYVSGDLITRSEAQSLQEYLRKTRGPIPAAHPRLLKKLLPDIDQLVRLFHGKGGSRVLRSAAEQLGGYQELLSLSRSPEGKRLLREAIRNGQPHEVVEHVAQLRAAAQDESRTAGQEDRPARTSVIRVFTVEEFIQIATEAESTQTSATSPPAAR